jgi:phospholipid/cholesterol/gamma-HCH transport system substrate-binding protein
MDESILRFRVGIFVVIAMCILGILIFLNSEGWVQQYTIFIKPTSAPGVTAGTPIRKNGILIGRVKSVKTQDDHVLLTLGINRDERIFENEVCSIGAESILGDSVVEFMPMSAQERGRLISENHVMAKVALKRNPLEFIDMFADLKPELSETLAVVRTGAQAVDEAGKGIRELTDSVQNAFQDEDSDFKQLLADFRLMSQKAQVALENFNRIFENANEIVGDPELKGQIKSALAEIPKIFQEIRVTVADTRETIRSFGTIPDGVNSNLENLEVFTRSLKQEGPEVLAQINASLENVDQLVAQVKAFTSTLSNIQNSDSSISRFLNDTEIYDEVRRTVANIRDTSEKLEPLMNDLRMFGDSLARDPGVIGVRGALDRRPSKTGAKGTAGRERGLFR